MSVGVLTHMLGPATHPAACVHATLRRSLRAAPAEAPGAHGGELAAAAGAKLRARLSPPKVWTWRHIVGIVLSVAVSFTSSLDRECGSSLYMVLFACLLDMRELKTTRWRARRWRCLLLVVAA